MSDANPKLRPGAIERVKQTLQNLGLEAPIIEMPSSTRTAEEAAAACGCSVGQIVKSLIFRGKQSGRPILLLVSGSNRVDLAKAAAAIGEEITRPDAAYVRDVTGFAIGGIPPFGHDTPMFTGFDASLLNYKVVWAAAGTPNAVMALYPQVLADATKSTILTFT